MKCDSCGEQADKLYIVAVKKWKSYGKEQWCDECMTDAIIVEAQYENGIANGEPWALPDNPELWNPTYKEE